MRGKTAISKKPTALVPRVKPDIPQIVDTEPLQGARKTFSDKEIAEGFVRADKAKKNFQIECIRTGLMLQVKKAELKHGQFKPYIEKLQKGSALPFSASYDSAKVYMKFAEYFSKWLNDKEQPVTLSDEGVMALLSKSDKKRKEAYKIADDFVNGRSLRRMLKDFRQAEKAAAEEGKPKEKPSNQSPDQIRAEAREVIREEIAESINNLRRLLTRPGIEFLEPTDFEEFGDHLKYTAKQYAALGGRSKS